MKRDLRTLALGIIIGAAVGMGVGPTLAMAYSSNPSQDTVRALRGHCQHAEVARHKPRRSRQHPRPPGNFAGTSIHRLDPEEPATVGSRRARGPRSGLRSSRRNDAEGYVGFGAKDIWTGLPSTLELPDIWTAYFRRGRACAMHGWFSDDGGGSCASARARGGCRRRAFLRRSRRRGLLFLAVAQGLRLRSAVRITATGGDGSRVPSPWS